MVRIFEQSPQAAKKDTLRLLGWLVCAKRPLKWHEIQVMNSISLEERRISSERQSFIKSPKDLLASLVETRADGSLEFVHLTAKLLVIKFRIQREKGGLGMADDRVAFFWMKGTWYP